MMISNGGCTIAPPSEITSFDDVLGHRGVVSRLKRAARRSGRVQKGPRLTAVLAYRPPGSALDGRSAECAGVRRGRSLTGRANETARLAANAIVRKGGTYHNTRESATPRHLRKAVC
ncbi:unnamed protein product, partial [Iphiclides podalirius]